MQLAFEKGIKEMNDGKSDEMVESIIRSKSISKVEAVQALLPRKKGKIKRFFGAISKPFRGSGPKKGQEKI